VRSGVHMAVNMEMTAFWDMVLCSLVEVDRHFNGAYCLHCQGDGGSKHLWNVDLLVWDCTVPYIQRLSSLTDTLNFNFVKQPFAKWRTMQSKDVAVGMHGEWYADDDNRQNSHLTMSVRLTELLRFLYNLCILPLNKRYFANLILCCSNTTFNLYESQIEVHIFSKN
jgi:hypothetical protein